MLVLLEHGYRVTIVDNLDNSFQKAYDRMVELAGDKAGGMKFIEARAGWPGCGGSAVAAAVGAVQTRPAAGRRSWVHNRKCIVMAVPLS